MKCEDVQNQLTQQDGMPEGQIKEHLEHCNVCRDYLNHLAKLTHLYEKLEHPHAPAELSALTSSKIRQRLQHDTIKKNSPRGLWIVAGVSALLMILWIGGLYSLPVQESAFTLWIKGLAMVLAVQNVIMLLCSPLLLRARHVLSNIYDFKR